MELHILFFILAGLLIAILIGVSLWSARREKSRIFSNAFSKREPSTPLTQNQMNQEIPDSLKASQYQYEESSVFSESPQEIQKSVEDSLNSIKISLPEQQPAQTGQYGHTYQTNTVSPSYSTLETSHAMSSTQSELSGYEHQAVQANSAPHLSGSPEPQVSLQTSEPSSNEQHSTSTENRMIMLYVVAPQNQAFNGELTVQTLEALGLQYGEHQIFHRHQVMGNSSSPVIFSVANMMQPGIFDLSKIQQFSTIGLVMFMYLPSEGNDLVNLKLLLKTAENLAQSLGGFVLNEQREIFDESSRQAYLSLVQ